MTIRKDVVDVLVIGGGLAGLLCAEDLGRRGLRVLVLDRPLAAAQGLHGGFSVFSGAKFSLPPAGMGLAPVVGGVERLTELCLETIHRLGLADRIPLDWSSEESSRDDEPFSMDLRLRRYRSIVLLPNEIRALVQRLHELTARVCEIETGSARQIYQSETGWSIEVTLARGDVAVVDARVLVLAGGRTFSRDLLSQCIPAQSGKGIDVGVRIEFESLAGTEALYRLGADAKIISGDMRTFCLNHPGAIFWYEENGIWIPGGVVAEPGHDRSNVGILMRRPNRERILQVMSERSRGGPRGTTLEGARDWSNEAFKNQLTSALGEKVAEEILEFVVRLHGVGLVNLAEPHRVHLPLIDWYWPTYALPNSLRSSAPNVWVLGDSSGHARGLLQSAVSGVAASSEIAR